MESGTFGMTEPLFKKRKHEQLPERHSFAFHARRVFTDLLLFLPRVCATEVLFFLGAQTPDFAQQSREELHQELDELRAKNNVERIAEIHSTLWIRTRWEELCQELPHTIDTLSLVDWLEARMSCALRRGEQMRTLLRRFSDITTRQVIVKRWKADRHRRAWESPDMSVLVILDFSFDCRPYQCAISQLAQQITPLMEPCSSLSQPFVLAADMKQRAHEKWLVAVLLCCHRLNHLTLPRLSATGTFPLSAHDTSTFTQTDWKLDPVPVDQLPLDHRASESDGDSGEDE